ncbi:PHD finger protein 7-like isoform X2 [Gallus gallus]|uniref:PHD-type domain-containing protein n=1 Tax=Gallus gallus TaxID=9031 RepID=A0A8V1AJZ7_CHICK|nr:PHD finger protein 7-like [Gallus gallus]XP_025000212.2 PHD finger protein 7-like isoform X1 [Gallus gallus]XP_040509535.1 PHD finger protein 7-like [Gallus gallus]XP_040509536.1 PHD finger protein 7-like isoform X1 [Gallus gallus]XP_040548355.1 PHD finger protein 7-like isoform X2 [Gallus gallus]XP_040548927.1 PHD finger protein 7-like [Gallus gallus]XP_040548928.1 PHD finger protein 7-like isoform X2 [Gallus gallus]|eukprot:XP_025000166.1 PHD finger protein 7-like [Gallus gallus]
MRNMSSRKRKSPDSGEQACVLCRRADVNPDICGRTFAESDLCVHEFCLLFANIRFEESAPWEETVGLPVGTIRCRIKQADQKQCFVCGERGAAISCAERGCARSFHLPCAVDGECVTQFFGQHRSFCREHRPRQAVEAAPSQGTDCVICLEPMGDSTSYQTLRCPACKHTWFHRSCVQGQAMNAGTMCFQCPICQDTEQFRAEMSTLGIQIPVRRPSWWDDRTYPSLLRRHGRCDVSTCLYPGGREQEEADGPWQLLLCSSCAAEGTHRRCSYLSNRVNSWECNSCAGVGTASSSNTERAGPSTSSQGALEPPRGSQGLENISSGPSSQAASGLPQRSQLPENSHLPSEPGTRQRTVRPRLPADHEASRHRGSGRTTAPRTSSGSRRSTQQRASRPSADSPVAAPRRGPRQQGTGRVRSRSPLQDRASRSQSRPRRSRGSRQTPRQAARSSTLCSATPVTSRPSRGSPQPGHRRASRQQGRAHT